MSYTPGKWTQYGSIIFSPGCGVICELSEPRPESGYVEHQRVDLGSPNWDEAMANGGLLKAAPELLEACEAAIQPCSKSWFCNIEGAGLYEQLRTAIAKAKGEKES